MKSTKLTAHYDSNGNIRALLCQEGPATVKSGVMPKPGHFVAEVEGLEVKGGAKDTDALAVLAKSHKVGGSPACKLTAKGS